MKTIRTWALAAVATAVLAACGGGGGDGDQTPRAHYSRMVSFGDSLSDVGTYKVSLIAAANGGQYSVNADNGSTHVPTNWTELLALSLGLPDPCAAVTGLNSIIPQIASAPVTSHSNCFNYAEGGARVTNPVGPGNVNTYPSDPSGALGQLTIPVQAQIQSFLSTNGGKFSSDDLVTVLAGGNDIFMNVGAVQHGLMSPTQAGQAMAQAGAELAGYVKASIVGNGATHVVVVNLPDVSKTPYALSADQASPGAATMVNQLVQAFNQALAQGLSGTSGVLLVDAYTQSDLQAAHPDQYGLTNVTTPACDLAKLQTLLQLPTSLVCSSVGSTALGLPATVISGDISHYEYADSVHPTPYGYRLLAQFVAQQMTLAGWL